MKARFVKRSLLTALVWFAPVIGLAQTQAPQTDGEPASSSEQQINRLHSRLSRMVDHLKSLPGYSVEVDQQWKLEGSHNSSGSHRMMLRARHTGEFLLVAGNGEAATRSLLVCSSDGLQTVRQLRMGEKSTHSRQEGGLDDILQDAMTESCLRFSGLDLLCRPGPGDHMMVTASDIQYQGREAIDGQELEHYRMLWDHDPDHVCEIWVTIAEPPRLARLVHSLQLSPTADHSDKLTVTSHLKWSLVDDHPVGAFEPALPADSREVPDLHHQMVQGHSAELVGKPAPEISLSDVDGNRQTLPDSGGPVVLYFFSSRFLPGTDDRQDLVEVVEEFRESGFRLVAISVGESVNDIRAFAESGDFSHAFLVDGDRKVSDRYGVTSLPTVVLIDRDGQVKGTWVGNSGEVREELERELRQMQETGGD